MFSNGFQCFEKYIEKSEKWKVKLVWPDETFPLPDEQGHTYSACSWGTCIEQAKPGHKITRK